MPPGAIAEALGVSASLVTSEAAEEMRVAYHRRPLVGPDRVAALALASTAIGSSWPGSYPTRTEHVGKLRIQQLFRQTYGAHLAELPAILPEPGDDLRWVARADAERGYLFVSNQRGPRDVQFEVQFAERRIALPAVKIRSRSCFAWPLRQRFNDIPALTVTAQPITELEVADETYVLFAATPGIDVELFVEGVDADWVLHADVEPAEGGLIVRPQREPGQNCEIWIGMTTLVFLDEATAEAVRKGEVAGRERLVVWAGDGWFDGGFHAVVSERDRPLDVFPALAQGVTHEGEGSVFTRYRVPGGDVVHPLAIPVFPVAVPAPARRNDLQKQFSAPCDEDFESLEAVSVPIPPGLLERAGPLMLRLAWTGDVLRLYAGPELIAEQFWSGRELEIDLAPFSRRILAEGLWLKAFAWGPDSEVLVDPRVRPRTGTPLLTVHEASLIEIRTREMR
ncbi:hypothetical protein [Kineosporia sp. NBRC 101677]|uniref:hypothetical protein n=1 Tax=Kineosporia sp. NBRC 101677 TaxID=3032197 RepID=UPI002556C9A8|nr:hypothetical protein [Kineosporia sp. NBRC 101677]